MKTITEQEYYQIVGLLTLAKEYNKALKNIDKALLNITKEEGEFGHSSDAVYCDYEAETLLSKLAIKVI